MNSLCHRNDSLTTNHFGVTWQRWRNYIRIRLYVVSGPWFVSLSMYTNFNNYTVEMPCTKNKIHDAFSAHKTKTKCVPYRAHPRTLYLVCHPSIAFCSRTTEPWSLWNSTSFHLCETDGSKLLKLDSSQIHVTEINSSRSTLIDSPALILCFCIHLYSPHGLIFSPLYAYVYNHVHGRSVCAVSFISLLYSCTSEWFPYTFCSSKITWNSRSLQSRMGPS